MTTKDRADRLRSAVRNRQAGLAIVLEDIRDPHNASAIMRSADAFGIQDVYLVFSKEKSWNPKRVGKSSSSSANKWLDFHIFKSISECAKELKEGNFELIATAIDEKAESLYKSDLSQKKIAIMVGNEHRGLSHDALELADRTIYLPMKGLVESLNVSVSAAILMYEVVRQRDSDKKYLKPTKAQEELFEDFISR